MLLDFILFKPGLSSNTCMAAAKVIKINLHVSNVPKSVIL